MFPIGLSCVLLTSLLCLDFPDDQNVTFLVGFTNKGEKDFIVETMDAAFHYPQDYSFYNQNVGYLWKFFA